ncbi:hypothetical protein [Methylobacterium frigidaeris]|uniref:Uncharacterized protein n=1 Tax=Methylobacterium frigidaeris TaxID=2038277 RepID=A0AA37M6Z7_9HYPH|nr:hypothetical protein [Methylobacterium frigidaeris]PIK70524.1 hypothetical protein CS379_24140 [Methylobacterium frigidaeris]GJD65140.1 hypothetical protein MPEAHAMD_5327 [Methylobacterium frigidaeris]
MKRRHAPDARAIRAHSTRRQAQRMAEARARIEAHRALVAARTEDVLDWIYLGAGIVIAAVCLAIAVLVELSR